MNFFVSPLLRVLLAATLILATVSPTRGATLVFGDSSYNLDSVEGSSGASGGGLIGSFNVTEQLQIVSADLAVQGLVAGSVITGVRTRINSGNGMVGDRSISDFEITLAQAANAIGSMSTTFADNMLDPVLVHDGAFSFFDAQMPEGSTPNAFGQLVSFDTPYTYQGGDLVFMFSRPSVTGGSGISTDHHFLGDGTIVRRLYGGTFHAATGSLDTGFAVLQLEFSSVPEPSRALLLMVGLLGTGLLRKRVRPLVESREDFT
ncbi:PEP-CTERM sorting domain-containing protein [Prosthecobacter sp.]|uniref:PEP-CTERM sorting domain-containing protein n=1 Tax=Prosthecobacter sp. TaxID=1965333 RepID=UPI001DA89A95|nr:PEP-CTERM sorting domain-containing protein [Prosthecobacter sp.]MCB1276334.1 PEP-CTERM sorting domain-containing protein [Prosthecobacter sp.]